ncbi:MAG: DUF4296 domain-containing protein [Sphingobacteriaceae bacterium]|nr:MAG: DUF4296 domain-containing protein [Sphingobacteriaceae bacterium]
MRFYIILFSFLLLFMAACNTEQKPDNLIDEARFTALMVDVHLADGYLNSKSQISDTLNYRGNGLYNEIFKKYQVDSVAFKNSYQYYSIHLEQMGRIYKTVLDRLTAKNDSITKKLAAEEMQRSRRVADSTAKVYKADSLKRVLKQDSSRKTSAKNSIAKPIANHK